MVSVAQATWYNDLPSSTVSLSVTFQNLLERGLLFHSREATADQQLDGMNVIYLRLIIMDGMIEMVEKLDYIILGITV